MTVPMKPAVDPTLLKPEEWQQYLQNALTALKANPRDREALQAIQDANFAMNAYEEAGAVSPGERISSGISAGLKGLGESVRDIPRGIVQTVLHPVQTVKNLPKVPGALYHGLTSGDQETVARTVGNIGGLLLPAARTSKAAGAPTVGAVASRAATYPLRLVGAVARRPFLKNALLEAQLARETAPAPAVSPAVPPMPGLLSIGEDLGAVARPSTPRPPPDLLDIPTFQRRNVSRPGHPIYAEGPAPTRSPEVRGGEPLYPKPNPTVGPVMAKLRQLSHAELMQALRNGPPELQELVTVELQRRGITIPGLGVPPLRGLLATP